MSNEIEELRERLHRAEALLEERTEELALLRLHLDALALVDGSTGLLNERGIEAALSTAIHRLDRVEEPFSLTGIRIPVLPQVFREHPDDRGRVLRHVSALMRAGLRAMDAVGRLDESTFAVVSSLPGQADPSISVNRLRSMLTAAPIEAGEDVYEPDARIAVVVGRPGASPSVQRVDSLLRDALSRAPAGEPVTVDA